MKLRTKLISSVIMALLAMAMLVVGVFAVKTAELNVGGSIVFKATGINATISSGTLNNCGLLDSNDTLVEGKVVDGVEKLKEVVFTTSEKIDNSTAITSWTGLKLAFTDENGADATITFTITNNDSKKLNVELSVNADSCNNAEVNVTNSQNSSSNNIAIDPASAVDWTITFHIPYKEVNASIENFSINFNFTYPTTQKVADVSIQMDENLGTAVCCSVEEAAGSETLRGEYYYGEQLGFMVTLNNEENTQLIGFRKDDPNNGTIISLNIVGAGMFIASENTDGIYYPIIIQKSQCETAVDSDVEGVKYEIHKDAGFARVVSYSGSATGLTLKANVTASDGTSYPVKLIDGGMDGGVFNENTTLKTLTVPEGYESIGITTAGSVITTINLPSSIKYIVPGAFFVSPQLQTINFNSGNETYEMRNGKFLINKKEMALLTVLGNEIGTLPSDIKIIDSWAIYGVEQYTDTTLEIPSSVVACGSLFTFTDRINEIYIPSSVLYLPIQSIGGG